MEWCKKCVCISVQENIKCLVLNYHEINIILLCNLLFSVSFKYGSKVNVNFRQTENNGLTYIGQKHYTICTFVWKMSNVKYKNRYPTEGEKNKMCCTTQRQQHLH